MSIYSLDAWDRDSARKIFGRSENNDGVADADQVFNPNGVPVREANATVTRSAADRLRIIGAVNADAGFVQTHPKHANQIIRAGGQVVIVFRPDAIVKHALVIAKPGPRRRALNFPGSNRRRQCGRAGRDRENANKFIIVEDFKQPLFGIDINFARSEFRFRRNFLLSDLFDLKREDVWNSELVAGFEMLPIHPGI